MDITEIFLGYAGKNISHVFLLSLRVSAVFFMTPILYGMPIPQIVRVLVCLGIAVVLSMALPIAPAQIPLDFGDWVAVATAEIVIGATLGLGVLSAFGAFSIAGRMLDIQVGFGLAQVIDPVTRRQIPVLDAAFNHVGLLVFLLLNGHNALLRGIASSFDAYPVGTTAIVDQAADVVFRTAGGLFALGFALAAPVVFCLLLVELVLGVVARNLPQMNMFVVALPLKVVVALVALSLWLPNAGGAMTRIYGSVTAGWADVFRAHAAVPGGRP